MLGQKLGILPRSFVLLSIAIAIAIVLSAAPVRSASTISADSSSKAAASSASAAEPKAQASPAKKTLRQKVKAVLKKINPMRLARDREYKKASALFPGFCKDWERKLHDRQVNNEDHIAWAMKDGWETGNYVGYSTVKKCECHQSTDGYSIGKVGYDEFEYYLVGKTADDAKHATPKVTETTNTTELFRWDKNKWFY